MSKAGIAVLMPLSEAARGPLAVRAVHVALAREVLEVRAVVLHVHEVVARHHPHHLPARGRVGGKEASRR